MDVITRPEARQKSLKTYFTGLPCKNGHISPRYTQSGTCADCIKQSNGGKIDHTAHARKEAKANLVQVRVRVFDVDRDAFAASAWALAVMRYPVLNLGDIDPRLLGSDRTAGTGLYAFYCHADDVAQLREIAAAMCNAHTLDVDARRLQIIQGAAAYLPPDTTPPMSFK